MNTLQDFKKFSPEKKSIGNNKNAIIYTRVSTKEQADTNTSLETQKKYIFLQCIMGLKNKEPIGTQWGEGGQVLYVEEKKWKERKKEGLKSLVRKEKVCEWKVNGERGMDGCVLFYRS